jgi:hypothetical protein
LAGASLRQLHSFEKAAGGHGPSLAASTTRNARIETPWARPGRSWGKGEGT